jgi:hypothetical protein
MIERLSQRQIDRFPEFVEKWTRIGLSTAPIDRKAVETALAGMYGVASKPPPKAIFCTSPFAASLTIAALAGDKVSASVNASVNGRLSGKLHGSLSASIFDSVSDKVSAGVFASVRNSVYGSVIANVYDSVRASVSDNVSRDSVQHYYDYHGQFAASWLSYYDYMREVCGVDTSILDGNSALVREAGASFLYWDLAFISEKPLHVHRNDKGQLHKDGCAALDYSDGFGVYALNGVRMPAKYVLTLAENINPELVLKEKNVDIRRELIRKVGIERMLVKLPHKSLSKSGNYEVFSIDLGDGVRDARFLKMQNPSLGVWHLEGVAPQCDTVEKALNWRNSHWFNNAEILT